MFITTDTIPWVTESDFDHSNLTEWQWHWLSNRGSLTQKLREYTHGIICLCLQSEAWQIPLEEECAFLAVDEHEHALIREIEWQYQQQTWIKGRVIIPKLTTLDQGEILTKIGEQSLGDILFTDPNLKRSEFYFQQNEMTATRRSIFNFYQKPLLVEEQFLFNYFKENN